MRPNLMEAEQNKLGITKGILLKPMTEFVRNLFGPVPSTTRPVLFSGVLRFPLPRPISFGLIDGAREASTIILSAVANVSTPLDRTRRVVLGTGL
ncbi:unnamed protein product [Adineta ricciae]|uniref:Uncharacterized protein n=1 Tax=Adineta ricciae TaxID=249248 RepID=A0A813MVG8_ADIRI|nr:unnamed protein product [Adineta ricciae]CAF0894918.1 unnamed protein product [Adineta ricciae]